MSWSPTNTSVSITLLNNNNTANINTGNGISFAGHGNKPESSDFGAAYEVIVTSLGVGVRIGIGLAYNTEINDTSTLLSSRGNLAMMYYNDSTTHPNGEVWTGSAFNAEDAYGVGDRITVQYASNYVIRWYKNGAWVAAYQISNISARFQNWHPAIELVGASQVTGSFFGNYPTGVSGSWTEVNPVLLAPNMSRAVIGAYPNYKIGI